MTDPPPAVALYYEPDAHTELFGKSPDGPAGLMGRQVAGKEFLDAYLWHGRFDTLTAVARSRRRAEPLLRLCQDHPSSRRRARRLRVVPEPEFADAFAAPEPPARVLHHPCPPDARFAWLRQAAGGRFALCGVTHTLSSLAAVRALTDLLTSPFEPFDTLICTSKAVAEMVRAVTGAYADFLADRFGGRPRVLSRLEVVPLGVDPERFRPATAPERVTERARLGAADDEVVVLCVGRLSHHAKAHPYPVFHAAAEAARRTGRKVLLVFSGWAISPVVDAAYRDAAKRFAAPARVAFANGLDPAVRTGAWRAADVFISLPDNVQETFGLVVTEAMASGLPVVGSDWDGYRDLVADGETGFLVPTRMVRGATAESTARHLFGTINYDHFLAECVQATAVDPAAAAGALARLVADAGLREAMGRAGRERALKHFTWERVVRLHETLWAEQDRAVRSWQPPPPRHLGPTAYPAPEHSYAGYPSAWLDDDSPVRPTAGASDSLSTFLTMPLTNMEGSRRCMDADPLTTLLRTPGPRSVGELVADLGRSGVGPGPARATVAWLLKYGLLELIPGAST
ncbi:MAG TPA: glycosyltransferase [Gemmataceae bacterium]|nr:glycosyltransferase [Gemmataceae bacterium]